MNIYAYGTLMFAPVWNRVVQGSYASRRVRLTGFRRRKIRGDHDPVLIPGQENDRVSGLAYLGVGPADLTRLDEFEGG